MSITTTSRAGSASVFLVATLVALSGCGSDRSEAPATKASTSKPAAAKPAEVASAKPAVGGVRQLKDTSFEHSWDLQLPKRIRNAWISPELPDVIFFQMVETYEIYAVDAYSGNTRWVTPAFDKPARLLPGASRASAINKQGDAVTDDRMWVISDDTLYCYDALFGQLVWRYALPFSPSTSPVAVGADANQRVFIGDWEGRLQVVTNHPEKNFPYVLWQMNLHQPLNAEPVAYEGLVYVGDHSGKVHCFKLDRDQVWTFDTGAAVRGSVLTRGRVLYVGNDNNTLYALNRLSGERSGALYMNGAIKRAPFAFDGEPGRIYVWVEAGGDKPAGLYAIKTQSDTVPFTEPTKHPLEVERMGVEWFVPGYDRLVGSTPEHLFVTKGTSPIIHALHRATGKVMWSWDTNELHKQYRDEKGRPDPREVAFIAEYQDSHDSNRSLYTADETGHVIAFRVFGDKPGDPLTGASTAKRAPLPAPKADAEKPADGEKPLAPKKKKADDKAAEPEK
jgi:outer membrane protein assembly factor BamB